MRSCVDAEFVVATADVLYERVTADAHTRGSFAFQTAHQRWWASPVSPSVFCRGIHRKVLWSRPFHRPNLARA